MKLNRKGFTLVEVLAVIVIIALLGGIAIPNILSTINTSKNVSEKSMIENIKTASQQLYEEVEFTGDIYQYQENGTITTTQITINGNSIETNLQTLVSNGFLSGTGEEEKKIIRNPKTGKNIGACKIKITKTVNSSTYETTYKVERSVPNSDCPDYN